MRFLPNFGREGIKGLLKFWREGSLLSPPLPPLPVCMVRLGFTLSTIVATSQEPDPAALQGNE
jgi:hypothetical protein